MMVALPVRLGLLGSIVEAENSFPTTRRVPTGNEPSCLTAGVCVNSVVVQKRCFNVFAKDFVRKASCAQRFLKNPCPNTL